MILKEWRCAEHGDFVGSHAICPAMGCESEHVERVFLTPPGMIGEKTKAMDSTLAGIASDYRLSDMSNRGGKAVLEADPGQMIWGREGVANYDGMLQQAATPTVVKDDGGREHVADNMGMRAAARNFGIDKRPLPPAQTTVLKSDAEDRSKMTKR